MAIDDVPRELREVSQAVLDELRAACEDGACVAAWLDDYAILELRAAGLVDGEDLEVYLSRPLLEDLGNLDLASRKQVLAGLRAIPQQAAAGAGRFWLVGEQGRTRALGQRPFA